MSLITRCPACETMFKVVPDQLRISEGWVRCGQCGEVFDASQRMVEQAPEAPPQSDRDTAEGNGTVADPSAPETTPPPESQPTLPATEPQEEVEEEDAPAPSFMRAAPDRSLWRHPVVRSLLLMLALLLLAALAAQMLIQNRDRIASVEPSTRPALLALCALARCQLSALRQIESIVIESSSFSRIRGDSYRLGFSLKNNSALDLAMPSIELALTDTQDQALIRRVVVPAEFGAGSRLLAAGSDWNASMSLSVKAFPGSERIAGYRVFAFYP